ncbi:enoyl-CoA hydratase/isomerase family protein [Paracoccaceae bacterium]|nr:enoyl-CoA hydratase/isomerase family protein [Paracoccaceae bacterium]
MFIIDFMVRVEFLKDEVASVSFDSGKRSNLLSLDIIRRLTETAKKLAHNKKLMAVILSGGQKNFSFGFDLKDKEFSRLKKLGFEENRDYFQLGKTMCEEWEKLNCLTICEIKGWCVGGGVALATSCDLRIAETAAKFYVPEVERGLNMSWGSVPRLIALLGPAKTKRLLLLGEKINSPTAKDWGLIDSYLCPSKLNLESIKFAKKAAEMPRLPFILTKESVNNHANAIAKATSYNDQDIFSLAYANLSGKFFE